MGGWGELYPVIFWNFFNFCKAPKVVQDRRALTEINDHLSVAASHVGREGQDAGHIVVEERLFLL